MSLVKNHIMKVVWQHVTTVTMVMLLWLPYLDDDIDASSDLFCVACNKLFKTAKA